MLNTNELAEETLTGKEQISPDKWDHNPYVVSFGAFPQWIKETENELVEELQLKEKEPVLAKIEA